MGKKPLRKPSDTVVRFRCRKEEAEEFRRCAERDGFGGNVSAWLLWHLRRIVRDSGDK